MTAKIPLSHITVAFDAWTPVQKQKILGPEDGFYGRATLMSGLVTVPISRLFQSRFVSIRYINVPLNIASALSVVTGIFKMFISITNQCKCQLDLNSFWATVVWPA